MNSVMRHIPIFPFIQNFQSSRKSANNINGYRIRIRQNPVTKLGENDLKANDRVMNLSDNFSFRWAKGKKLREIAEKVKGMEILPHHTNRNARCHLVILIK